MELVLENVVLQLHIVSYILQLTCQRPLQIVDLVIVLCVMVRVVLTVAIQVVRVLIQTIVESSAVRIVFTVGAIQATIQASARK